MTTKTTAELAASVMKKLSSIDLVDAVPDASSQAEIIDIYTTKMAVLRDEEIAYWEDAAIPLEVFEAMVRIVAHEFAPIIGEPIPEEQDEDGRVKQVGPIGMRLLRRHVAKQRSGEPTPIEAY